MARLLPVQSREEFGISRLRRQLFKEYTISCVLERRLISLDDFRFGSKRRPSGAADLELTRYWTVKKQGDLSPFRGFGCCR
jgi:hypothetical protein